MTIALGIGLSAARGQGAPKPIDAGALVNKAEVAAILGELKGEPEVKDGLRGKKCSFETLKGAWVTVEAYPAAPHWESMQNMALDVQPLTGLGESAFSAKRGATRQVYVKKGAWVIEVDSSAGLDVATKLAGIAVKRMP